MNMALVLVSKTCNTLSGSYISPEALGELGA